MDVCNFMFGSILAMSRNDVYLSVALSIMVFILFIFFYNKLFAITFDESFARAGGVKVGTYNMLIALLTALTIVLGMRMMGALLISSLIIFPALTAMRIFKSFKTVTICSAIVAVVCFFIGIMASYVYATPAGASVVMMNIFAFLIFWAISAITRSKLCKERTMKKTAIMASLVLVLLFTNCGRGDRDDGAGAGIVEIRENMFITQINAINLNFRDYIGRPIVLEGMFRHFQWGESNIYIVYRKTPGCCEEFGEVGFRLSWNPHYDGFDDGSDERTYPNRDDWVQVQGVLNYFELFGRPLLYIALSELNVLETRGREFVTR